MVVLIISITVTGFLVWVGRKKRKKSLPVKAKRPVAAVAQ